MISETWVLFQLGPWLYFFMFIFVSVYILDMEWHPYFHIVVRWESEAIDYIFIFLLCLYFYLSFQLMYSRLSHVIQDRLQIQSLRLMCIMFRWAYYIRVVRCLSWNGPIYLSCLYSFWLTESRSERVHFMSLKISEFWDTLYSHWGWVEPHLISRTIEFLFLKHHFIWVFGALWRKRFIHLLEFAFNIFDGISWRIPPLIISCARSLLFNSFNIIWLFNESLIKCLYLPEEPVPPGILNIQNRSKFLMTGTHDILISSLANFV